MHGNVCVMVCSAVEAVGGDGIDIDNFLSSILYHHMCRVIRNPVFGLTD